MLWAPRILGDRVLGLVIADWLLRTYPQEFEGLLARRFSFLVRRQTLFSVDKKLELEKHMLFNPDSSQKRHVETILSDGARRCSGHVFLDGGLSAAQTLIYRYWEELMNAETEPSNRLFTNGLRVRTVLYLIMQFSRQQVPIIILGLKLKSKLKDCPASKG